ncbi:antigen 5 like allergen Cul n 1-like [Musca vetustissima]|uniref:antigen 5 like allergen Cul n 1-like n=1 Tax=Musca vetustissima TaxID=27455 RepID=UPI002AB6ABCC|nr:antigen 5 like allergen Cul n 1-like [Musca vetustissima]
MLKVTLILFVTTIVALAAGQTDYCDTTFCPDGIKHVACEHSGNFSSTCPKNAAMVVIGDKLIQIILKAHNRKRHEIASGAVPNFKPACRMATMKWNQELAKLAALNVRKCEMEHDECFTTVKYKYAGQNLAWRSFVGDMKKTELISEAIDDWYAEVENASMDHIDAYPDNYAGPPIGHFTAMVGERNIAVGCAAATYTVEGETFKRFLVACNYATTNVIGSPVYTSCTTATEKCVVGRNTNFPALCGLKEEYDVNTW